MKKNTLKDGLDTKKDAKRDAKSSFCCSAIGVREREARRPEDRVFLLMEERKPTGIGLMNPTIREEGSLQIRNDQEVFD